MGFERDFFPALCIFLGTCGLYFNSIDGDFVFDDMPAIVNNADVDPSKSSMEPLWRNNFWGQPMGDPTSQHLSYRPLTTLTFRLNCFWHGLTPKGFHLFNIILHSCTCVLYYFVCRELHGYKATPRWVSFIAAVAFAAHPVHVEAVANIVGRAEILAAFFFFSTFLLYVQACQRSIVWLVACCVTTTAAVLSKEQGVTVIALCVAYDVFQHCEFDVFTDMFGFGFATPHDSDEVSTPTQQALKLFTNHSVDSCGVTKEYLRLAAEIPKFIHADDKKELSIFTHKLKTCDKLVKPVQFVKLYQGHSELMTYLLSTKNLRDAAADSNLWLLRTQINSVDSLTTEKRKVFLQAAIRILVYVAVVAYIMKLRFALNKGDEVKVDVKTNPANHIEDFRFRALTKFYYCVLHFWLLVFPFDLCCDWSSFGIVSIESFTDPRNMASLICFVVVLTLWGVAIGHPSRRFRTKMMIAFVFTFVPFLPASGLFLEVGFVVAERILYTPSAGACFYFSFYLWERWRTLKLAQATNVALIKAKKTDGTHDDHNAAAVVDDADDVDDGGGGSGGLWTPHSGVWLCACAVVVAFAYTSLRRNVEWKSERSLYESGIAVLPNNAKLHHNYAHTIADDNVLSHKTEHHYRKAISIYPPYGSAYINLGVHLAKSSRLDEAVTIWKEGFDQWNKYPILGSDPVVLCTNLGLALKNLGRPKEALGYLEKCLKRDPNNAKCQTTLKEVQSKLR
eukprot:m.54633 g.54633  ORF g.54633 m.54633 type:complete len:733 (-) comp21947_c0_seq1:71-2269(-)